MDTGMAELIIETKTDGNCEEKVSGYRVKHSSMQDCANEAEEDWVGTKDAHG
jgi:hypothetical protein